MSNCIDIRRRTVFFSSLDIDVKAFLADVARVHALPRDPYNDNDAAARRDSVMWWFLGRNVTAGAGGVVVEFGESRSTHTWRDFSATCKIIGSYMRRTKRHTFNLADEGDAYAERFNFIVSFGKDVEPFKY